MTACGRILLGLLAAASLLACDSVELTIGASPAADGALGVSNANDAAWADARLLVEAVESDGSTTVCAEETVASWRPGETVTVPVCGDKLRLTLTTGGDTARFVWANGQLYRKLGRKEIPMHGS
ncbi:MAG TPA: hypothetical protein VLT32_17060 [Candidatus Sulfomarinibacteraceae bacterium]|nr:hypothetical protein [Candidatus Sulfomarinibacteraceae bacterium]